MSTPNEDVEIVQPNPTGPTTNVENDKSNAKKAKGGNWSPAEEEKLAEAWLHVSQQAETGTNQTVEDFHLRVTNHLNANSPFDDRDANSVRIKWGSLQTATVKFSSYYAQIERDPPSGSVETDWIERALEVYSNLNNKKKFKSLPAWRILSTAPKWIVPRPPPGPLAMSIAAIPSSDAADATNPSTPGARPSTPPRPIGNKQTKRKRLEDTKAKAEELKEAREEHLKKSNELAERRVQALEEGNRMVKELAKSDAEAKASLTQVNELKVLMMDEESCKTDLAKDVLRLMQQRLKDKYQVPNASGASTSNT